MLTARRVLLAALICSVIAAVLRHVDHVGALEWVVSVVLVVALVYALATSPPRRA